MCASRARSISEATSSSRRRSTSSTSPTRTTSRTRPTAACSSTSTARSARGWAIRGSCRWGRGGCSNWRRWRLVEVAASTTSITFTVLGYSDLLRHPVHQVRLAVLRVGPEAQEEVVPGLEGRRELRVRTGVEGRHTPQPAPRGQRTLLTALLPRDEVLQRLSRREGRNHNLVGLGTGILHPDRAPPGGERPGELKVVVVQRDHDIRCRLRRPGGAGADGGDPPQHPPHREPPPVDCPGPADEHLRG